MLLGRGILKSCCCGLAVIRIIRRGKSCSLMSDAGGAKVGPAAKSVLNEFTGLFRKREEPNYISMTAAEKKKIFRLVTTVFFSPDDIVILAPKHRSDDTKVKTTSNSSPGTSS